MRKGHVSWVLPNAATLTLQTEGDFPYLNEDAISMPQRMLRGKMTASPQYGEQHRNQFRSHTG